MIPTLRSLLLVAFAATSASGVLAQDNPTLLTWGKSSITRQDFTAAVNANVPQQNRDEFLSDMKRVTQVLDQIQIHRSLAEEARAMGLDKDPLLQREIVLATERILAGRRLEAHERSLKRPDFSNAAKDQYTLRQKQFEVPEAVDVSHILVSSRNRSDAEARARAEEARKKAVAGADFRALAKEYSEDSSAARNEGNLGFVPRGRTVKPFEDAAFAMNKPGQISDVVQTQFGYHVIRFNARQAARQRPFEEVRNQIITELEERWVETQRAEFLSKIRNDPSIKLNTVEIDKLLTRIPTAAVPAKK